MATPAKVDAPVNLWALALTADETEADPETLALMAEEGTMVEVTVVAGAEDALLTVIVLPDWGAAETAAAA